MNARFVQRGKFMINQREIPLWILLGLVFLCLALASVARTEPRLECQGENCVWLFGEFWAEELYCLEYDRSVKVWADVPNRLKFVPLSRVYQVHPLEWHPACVLIKDLCHCLAAIRASWHQGADAELVSANEDNVENGSPEAAHRVHEEVVATASRGRACPARVPMPTRACPARMPIPTRILQDLGKLNCF